MKPLKNSILNRWPLIPFIAGVILCSGCSDFLERSAQNLVIPKTTAQYKEILQYEGYFRYVMHPYGAQGNQRGCYGFFQYMTDDVEYFDALKEYGHPSSWNSNSGEDDKVETYAGVYHWDAITEGPNYSDNAFIYQYRQIMVANVCLEGVDKSEGTQEEKEVLRGQAAFSRAFAYFNLANIYAKPYASLLSGKAQPTDLCVPIKENATPTTELYARATIAEVWDLISSDIQTALDNLKGKGLERNKYEISYPAALVLATRIALYKEEWDRVIALGEELLRDYPAFALYDISGKTTAGPRIESENETYHVKFMNVRNTEVIWAFGRRHNEGFNQLLIPLMTKNELVRYLRASIHSNEVNTSLIDMYTAGDRRKNYWFFEPILTETKNPSLRYDYVPCKFDTHSEKDILYTCFALRTAEVYLNLAEAYARSLANRNTTRAIGLLNDLRKKRIDPALYADLSFADYPSSQAVRQLVWDERRRELCFEELHRWWDLRRTTQPRIKHPWRNNTYYILEEGDPAYVLNFPESEMSFAGPVLIPNIRPDRRPLRE
jgi:hypothetical protein